MISDSATAFCQRIPMQFGNGFDVPQSLVVTGCLTSIQSVDREARTVASARVPCLQSQPAVQAGTKVGASPGCSGVVAHEQEGWFSRNYLRELDLPHNGGSQQTELGSKSADFAAG